jgi:hypothetical protein
LVAKDWTPREIGAEPAVTNVEAAKPPVLRLIVAARL